MSRNVKVRGGEAALLLKAGGQFECVMPKSPEYQVGSPGFTLALMTMVLRDEHLYRMLADRFEQAVRKLQEGANGGAAP